jgi:UDP-3-O-[3-hydroxymyristoyl] glucosamine N-acyltransferase
MIKAIYGVYGASGFGREVLPHVRKYLLANHVSLENLYFIDDGLNSTFVNGCNVVTYSQFRAIEAKNKFVSIAIADKDIRRKLSIKIIADGVVPLSVVSDKAEVLDEVKIGQGHILCSNVTITSNVKIGTFFQANIDSYVGMIVSLAISLLLHQKFVVMAMLSLRMMSISVLARLLNKVSIISH